MTSINIMTPIEQYLENWSESLSCLDLEITKVSSDELGIKSGFSFLPLLKDFGGSEGMILFPEGTRVLSYHTALSNLGYGYSVIESPSQNDDWSPDKLMEMLSDWGWTGVDEERPVWLTK